MEDIEFFNDAAYLDDYYYLDEENSASIFEIFVTFIFIGIIVGLFIRDYLRNRRTNIHPANQQNIDDYNRARNNEEIIARRMEEVREGRTSRECVVCLESDAKFGVLTNCGHVFCCSCIIGYWRHSASIITPVNCPTCRASVSMILPLSWPVDGQQENENEFKENDVALNEYNKRFSTQRPWMDYIKDLPVLIPYIIRNIFDLNGNGMMLVFRIRMAIILLIMVLYLLSPFDIVPEGVHGFFGLLDDFLIVFIVFIYVASAVRDFMAHRGEVHAHNQ